MVDVAAAQARNEQVRGPVHGAITREAHAARTIAREALAFLASEESIRGPKARETAAFAYVMGACGVLRTGTAAPGPLGSEQFAAGVSQVVGLYCLRGMVDGLTALANMVGELAPGATPAALARDARLSREA